MADFFNSVWLYSNDFNAGGHWSTYTLVVPKLDVVAQIAVSAYVPVVYGDSIGGSAIGARIMGYSYFESEDVVIPVTTPSDWDQNAVWVAQCASITFGLECKNAWGYALGTVFAQ
jgi:hypothetical protein